MSGDECYVPKSGLMPYEKKLAIVIFFILITSTSLIPALIQLVSQMLSYTAKFPNVMVSMLPRLNGFKVKVHSNAQFQSNSRNFVKTD